MAMTRRSRRIANNAVDDCPDSWPAELDDGLKEASGAKEAPPVSVHMFNGVFKFNPNTSLGKWVFISQTLLSFTPLLMLLVQNCFNFADIINTRELNMQKRQLVDEVVYLTQFITALQSERSSVAQALFISMSSGTKMNLTSDFQDTDAAVMKVTWNRFGVERIFDTKLRFQIRLDDFRGYLLKSIAEQTADEATIEEVLNFYNMATSRILNFIATEIGKASSSNNWRTIMTSFNTIKIVESAGIGLVFGLRYYGNGVLKENELVIYVQHHGLLWEYYRKGMELVPLELKPVLDDLYKGRAFQYLTRGAVPILENVPREPNYKNGVTFYVECRKFISEALELLAKLRFNIRRDRDSQLYALKLGNVWAAVILVIIAIVAVILVLIARRAIRRFRHSAANIERKALLYSLEKKEQEKLVNLYLPDVIQDRLRHGVNTMGAFNKATVLLFSIHDFDEMINFWTPQKITDFLSDYYAIVESAYKSTSYDDDVLLIKYYLDGHTFAAGLMFDEKAEPVTSAKKICQLALKISRAVVVLRGPKANAIKINAGIHTGSLMAGVIKEAIPRYSIIGQAFFKAKQVQKRASEGRILTSSETRDLLAGRTGFVFKERQTSKDEDHFQTFWLCEEMLNKGMVEDYECVFKESTPVGIGAGCGAGAEVSVANSSSGGGGGGGGGKTVRFQSRPKKLGNIKEDSR